MGLREEIDLLLKDALKKREKEKINVYRLLKSEIKNKEVEVMHPLSDEEVMRVIASMIKKRRDSVEQYRKGGREDLAEAEEREIAILEELLPPPLSSEELEKIVSEVIQELGAREPSDFGRVMKVVMGKVQGRADGKEVNRIVRKLLDNG